MPPPSAPLVTLVGNPRTASRTRDAAEQLAVRLAPHIPGADAAVTIDLATLGPGAVGAAEPPSTSVAAQAFRDVAGARVLLVATPVYKASYTGLLKLFLDQLPPQALAGTVTVPVTVAAAPGHAPLADLHLRPVLAELGASLPVPALVLVEKDLPNVAEAAGAWVARYAPVVRALVAGARVAS